MTAVLAPVPVAKFFDNNGAPLAFGLLTTYAAGTTTPQATYIDSTQITPNTNPITLNFRGECNLWLDPTLSYKFLLQDFLGNIIPGGTVDNIQGQIATAQQIGQTLFPETSTEISVGAPPTSYTWPALPVLPTINVQRYGADPTSVADSGAAIMKAVAVAHAFFPSGARIYYPAGSYLVGTGTAVSYVFGNIHHEGESREATEIVNGSTNAPSFTVGDNVTAIFGGGFSKMRFTTKTAVTATGGQCALKLQKLGQFVLRDLFVSNARAAMFNGMIFNNCSQFRRYNIDIQACLDSGAIHTGTVDDYTYGMRSDGNSGAGLTFNNCQGIFYFGVTAFGNTGSAFVWQSTSGVNKNIFLNTCVGDTSGTYNWQIFDMENAWLTDCWGSSQNSTIVNTFAAGFIFQGSTCKGIKFIGGGALNNNSHGVQLNDPGASAPTDISFEGFVFGSLSNGSNGNGQAAGGGYGLAFNGVVDGIYTSNTCKYEGNATGSVHNQSSGTNIVLQNARGLVTANTVLGTIPNGSSSVVVTHGLAFTPNLNWFTGLNPSGNIALVGVANLWVDTFTSTQFTLHSNANTTGNLGVSCSMRMPGT